MNDRHEKGCSGRVDYQDCAAYIDCTCPCHQQGASVSARWLRWMAYNQPGLTDVMMNACLAGAEALEELAPKDRP